MVMGVDVEGASCRDGRVRARVCVVMSVWGARARVSPIGLALGIYGYLWSLSRVCVSLSRGRGAPAGAGAPRAGRAPGAVRGSRDTNNRKRAQSAHSSRHTVRARARVCR